MQRDKFRTEHVPPEAIRRVTTAPYPYFIFYQATDNEIIIHAVRHGARASYDFWGSTPRGHLREQ
jgi:plasmid stabilization system protein ParE